MKYINSYCYQYSAQDDLEYQALFLSFVLCTNNIEINYVTPILFLAYKNSSSLHYFTNLRKKKRKKIIHSQLKMGMFQRTKNDKIYHWKVHLRWDLFWQTFFFFFNIKRHTTYNFEKQRKLNFIFIFTIWIQNQQGILSDACSRTVSTMKIQCYAWNYILQKLQQWAIPIITEHYIPYASRFFWI